MTDRFEVKVITFDNYAEYKSEIDQSVGIEFDIIKDGNKLDKEFDIRYECCRKALRELVETADVFLTGNIEKNRKLYFDNPRIFGDCYKYHYYFDIVVEDCDNAHWIFNISYEYEEEKMKSDYSCELSIEQVAALRDSVEKQLESIDWENYGKTDYYEVDTPIREYKWCYSALQLERELKSMLEGEKLVAICVSGTNYIQPLVAKDNCAWYYLGSRIYMQFENIHLDILFHAYGLFQFCVYNPAEVTMTKRHDRIDDDDFVLCDTKYIFSLNYTNEVVANISVEPIDFNAYSCSDFDDSQLGNPIEVPKSIIIHFNNNTFLEIRGGDDDFSLEMKMDAK